jgi:hypothetical protein
MMTIVTHVHLKEGLDASGTPPCAPVCRPRGSDRVGWEDSSSGNPINQTDE